MEAALPPLRLSISEVADPQYVRLTILNTIPGRVYRLERATNPREPDWQLVQEVTGTGGTIPVLVSKLYDPVGIFRTTYEVDTPIGFDGLSYGDTGIDPPDVAGAIGREHIIQMMNSKFAVFDRAGNPAGDPLELRTFFGSFDAVDPRIVFDHRRDRWVASCVERTRFGDRFFPVRPVHLAVSKGSDPTPSPDNWWRFTLNFDLPKSDFDTLGMDSNGIYLTVTFLESGRHHAVVALPKELLYSGVLAPTILPVAPTEVATHIIQSAINIDEVSPDAPVLFVAKGVPHRAPAPDYRGGAIYYRRLAWQGNTAVWLDAAWDSISDEGNAYRNYFDFDDGTKGAPQRQDDFGGNLDINISRTGSRLCQAFVRDGHLWAAHQVGVSNSAGTYLGGPEGQLVDRSAIQWFKFRLNADNEPLTYASHGRILDASDIDPVWYHFPSVAVNRNGDAVFGFCGSGRQKYLSAYGALIPSLASQAGPATILQEGRAPCVNNSGADYSTTCLDPNDDSIWTLQEYSGEDRFFRTFIRKLSVSS